MPTPLEIDVATATRELQSGAMLLDVREPDELAICSLPGSTDIPMREVPSALDRLPQDRDILVLCHHGSRSLMVVRFLRAHGFERATNVAGGINAWAQVVDHSLPRY